MMSSLRKADSLAALVYSAAEWRPAENILTFECGSNKPVEARSYGQLWSNANRLAFGLKRAGIDRGNRIGILMHNHPEFVELMIAASILGCSLVPVDPRTRGSRLAYMLNNTACKGIVCADYSLDQLCEVLPEVKSLSSIWVLETKDEPGSPSTCEIRNAVNLREILDAPERSMDWISTTENDPLLIMHTSGTTGDPKGVIAFNRRYTKGGPLVVNNIVTGEDRSYCGLSLTHATALGLSLAPALAIGTHAVFSRKFTKSRFWDLVREYNCSYFSLSGGMATSMYSEPRKDIDQDNPARIVVSAGMPRSIWEKFEQRFSLNVVEFYGQTEGGGVYKPVGVGPIGSFGRPSSAWDVRILDEDGKECAPHVNGEICLRPGNGLPATVHYFNDPDASAKKTRGGWQHTGDIGHADEDGWLFFDYRSGDAIRRNGDFINPGDVECVLIESPDVNEVFVYGVTSSSGSPGERDVVAAIVPTDLETFDPSRVHSLCKRELAGNSVPSYLQILGSIPKTVSEKPQVRFLLMALAEDKSVLYEKGLKGYLPMGPGNRRSRFGALRSGRPVVAPQAASSGL